MKFSASDKVDFTKSGPVSYNTFIYECNIMLKYFSPA